MKKKLGLILMKNVFNLEMGNVFLSMIQNLEITEAIEDWYIKHYKKFCMAKMPLANIINWEKYCNSNYRKVLIFMIDIDSN